MASDPLALGAFARELGALVSLVPLGLTYGFSPPLYGVTLHLLARNTHPWRQIVYLTVGMALSALLLLLAFRTFDPTTLALALSGEVAHLLVQTVVDLVAGVVLVLVGLVFVVRSQTPRPEVETPRSQARASHAQALIGVGFANTAIGLWPPVTMYVTGRIISGATQHISLQVLGFAVFLAAVVGPYLAAAYLWRRMPRLSARVTRSYARLLRRDLRPLGAWTIVVAGLAFLALGAVTAAAD